MVIIFVLFCWSVIGSDYKRREKRCSLIKAKCQKFRGRWPLGGSTGGSAGATHHPWQTEGTCSAAYHKAPAVKKQNIHTQNVFAHAHEHGKSVTPFHKKVGWNAASCHKQEPAEELGLCSTHSSVRLSQGEKLKRAAEWLNVMQHKRKHFVIFGFLAKPSSWSKQIWPECLWNSSHKTSDYFWIFITMVTETNWNWCMCTEFNVYFNVNHGHVI